jgi:hypothetical protein
MANCNAINNNDGDLVSIYAIRIFVETRALVAVVLELGLSIQLNAEIALFDCLRESVLLLSFGNNEY